MILQWFRNLNKAADLRIRENKLNGDIAELQKAKQEWEAERVRIKTGWEAELKRRRDSVDEAEENLKVSTAALKAQYKQFEEYKKKESAADSAALDFEAFEVVAIERVPKSKNNDEHTLVGFARDFTKRTAPKGAEKGRKGHPNYFYLYCSPFQHEKLVEKFNAYLANKQAKR